MYIYFHTEIVSGRGLTVSINLIFFLVTKVLIVTGYAKGIKGGNEAAGNESYYSQTELIDFSTEKCDSTWPTFPIKGGVDGAQGC